MPPQTRSRVAAEGTGSSNGSASLSSSANAFAANLSLTGFGDYSGPLSGRFYGLAAGFTSLFSSTWQIFSRDGGLNTQTAQTPSMQFQPPFGGHAFNARPDGATLFAYNFGTSDVVATRTDATFTAYSTTTGAGALYAKLFNPGPSNPALALTYNRFADITARQGQSEARNFQPLRQG